MKTITVFKSFDAIPMDQLARLVKPVVQDNQLLQIQTAKEVNQDFLVPSPGDSGAAALPPHPRWGINE